MLGVVFLIVKPRVVIQNVVMLSVVAQFCAAYLWAVLTLENLAVKIPAILL